MTYDFKFWQELGWMCLVSAVIQVATVLTGLQPEAITDWRAWAIALSGGVIRAVAGVIVGKLTSPVNGVAK